MLTFQNDPDFASFARIYENPKDQKNSLWEWGIRLGFASETGKIFENVAVKTQKGEISEIEKAEVIQVYSGRNPGSICKIIKQVKVPEPQDFVLEPGSALNLDRKDRPENQPLTPEMEKALPF